jgi:hypothetical protein
MGDFVINIETHNFNSIKGNVVRYIERNFVENMDYVIKKDKKNINSLGGRNKKNLFNEKR